MEEKILELARWEYAIRPVLCFVFGMCYFTNDLRCLWLLFLLLAIYFIPAYEYRQSERKKDE